MIIKVKSMMDFQKKIEKENKAAHNIKKKILMYNAANDISNSKVSKYICFKILKLKTLYKLSIMLILFKIMIARIFILNYYL